jgi:hypothetical protein
MGRRRLISPPSVLGAALVVVAATLALGCARLLAAVDANQTESELAGLVDSDAARQLLSEILARHSRDPRLAAVAAAPRGGVEGGDPQATRLLDQAQLRELARETSMDFAALTFARALNADARSRVVQAAFERFLRAGADRSAVALRRPRAFPYTVLFAPSWLYQSHPETGSDFAHQRRLLDQLGIPSRLIAAGESDSVEDNALTVAEAVRAAGRDDGRVILVSASKSGAEAALALTRLLAPEEAGHVAAWVNIAGALRGTPLADAGLRPPASWLTRGFLWLNGWGWAGLASLATEPSRRRLEGARLPDTITVVNLVAVPVSRGVSYQVYTGYQILLSHGPNDGVVLLADTVWPGGVNLVALGTDHLFGRRRQDAFILAMLRAVDVAVRLHDHAPDPTVPAERDAD